MPGGANVATVSTRRKTFMETIAHRGVEGGRYVCNNFRSAAMESFLNLISENKYRTIIAVVMCNNNNNTNTETRPEPESLCGFSSPRRRRLRESRLRRARYRSSGRKTRDISTLFTHCHRKRSQRSYVYRYTRRWYSIPTCVYTYSLFSR